MSGSAGPQGGGVGGSVSSSGEPVPLQRIMECKICWTPYIPALGDSTRQIEPDTPFIALPSDWACPNCGGPKQQFMADDDPGADAAREVARLGPVLAVLESEFTELWHSEPGDLPAPNKALWVQPVGFTNWKRRPLGVVVTPWFMTLIQLPAEDESWRSLTAGTREAIGFPSGDYDFVHHVRPMMGGYKACVLFKSMARFESQSMAVDVARAVLSALFETGPEPDPDRPADAANDR